MGNKLLPKWLEEYNPVTKAWERFWAITHATTCMYDENRTVKNMLDQVGAEKGAGEGSVVAVDSGSEAVGEYSGAFGQDNSAKAYNNVFGKFAKPGIRGYESVQDIGDSLILGNGTPTQRSNSHRLTLAGETFGLSAYMTQGADYAEFFEWMDGNTKNESRVGLFVTMDGDKIKPAENGDYILGVVSQNPSVVGNADEDYCHKWLRNDFGKLIIENGEIAISPSYDKEKTYIPRSKRPEWDTIGLLGVVPVRDDGTCEVNGYCIPEKEGIATANDTGYRVIKRINENIIKIVLK